MFICGVMRTASACRCGARGRTFIYICYERLYICYDGLPVYGNGLLMYGNVLLNKTEKMVIAMAATAVAAKRERKDVARKSKLRK